LKSSEKSGEPNGCYGRSGQRRSPRLGYLPDLCVVSGHGPVRRGDEDPHRPVQGVHHLPGLRAEQGQDGRRDPCFHRFRPLCDLNFERDGRVQVRPGPDRAVRWAAGIRPHRPDNQEAGPDQEHERRPEREADEGRGPDREPGQGHAVRPHEGLDRQFHI